MAITARFLLLLWFSRALVPVPTARVRAPPLRATDRGGGAPPPPRPRPRRARQGSTKAARRELWGASKAPMRPASDVAERVCHDPTLDAAHFYFGFRDGQVGVPHIRASSYLSLIHI